MLHFMQSNKQNLMNLTFTTHSTFTSITDLPIKVDKALIEADVPFQNVHARAEKSLKSVTVLYYVG